MRKSNVNNGEYNHIIRSVSLNDNVIRTNAKRSCILAVFSEAFHEEMDEATDKFETMKKFIAPLLSKQSMDGN